MLFHIRVSNIGEDYRISDLHNEVWTCRIEDAGELVLLLNRVAIATTQFPVVEFPEVRISWDSHHVHIRAINGKLYYTELKSAHRRDLVVTPDEVIRLLEGQPVEQALQRDPDEDNYVRPSSGGRMGAGQFKRALLLLSLALLAVSGFYSWKTLSDQVRLVKAPNFVHTMENEGALLRKYADVYVSDLREGGAVFELTEDGRFSIYELWFSPKEQEYSLVPVDSFRVSGGLFKGKPALLAGEVHLLKLAENEIRLHGIPYERHGRGLSSLGDVLESGF